MNISKFLLSSLVVTSCTFASSIENKAVEYKNRVVDDILNGKNTAILYVGTGFIDMQPTYKNVDFMEIKNSPLLMTNISLTLFPDTLDLSFGYSVVIDTGDNQNKDVEYTNIFIKPIKTFLGDIGFGYKRSSFNTSITNKNSQTIEVIDMAGTTMPFDPGYLYQIKQNETLVVQTNETRLYFGYNLPSFKYLPDGIGFQYSTIEGQKPSIVAHQYIIAKQDITDGTRIDFGINKTKQELKNGFNIKRLGIYDREYTITHESIGFNKNSYETEDSGYYIEITYKNKFNIFSQKGNYLISIFRDVQENEEAVLVESGKTDSEGYPIWIDNGTQTKINDITQGIYFELSFNF
jgi:hypothetical protein